MSESPKNKPIYDLEERTFEFAKRVRIVLKQFNNNSILVEDVKQAIRSSGSVGANYIEANESLSKKDFIHRIKISRKEAKESAYWLRLIKELSETNSKDLLFLYNEAIELKKIFSSIIEKTKKL